MAAKGTMKISVVGDTSKFDRAMRSVDKKLGGLGKAAAKFGKLAAAGIGAAGAAAVAGAFKVASFGDEVAKSAGKAGLGVEQFQELRFAFEQGGVEAGTFDTAVQKFNKRLGESATTGGTADDAFQSLNVSLRDADGNVREASGAMEEVLPKLAQIESDSERAAVAGDLFGQRAGPELAAALSDGVEGIDEARQKAQDLGIVMGEEAARKAEQFSDSWDDVKRSTLGLLREGLTPLMGWMTDEAFPFIQNKLVPALADFRDWLGPKLSSAADTVERFLRTKVQPALRALGEWWNDNGDNIMQTAKGVRDAAVDMASKIERWVDDHLLPPLNAFGDLVTSLLGGDGDIRSDISGFVSWLGPFWREHGDDILQDAEHYWTSIRDEIESLLGQAKVIIEGITAAISGDWDDFLTTLQEDFDAFDEEEREEWESFMKGIRTTLLTISDLMALDWQTALARIRGETDEHAAAHETNWSQHKEKLKEIASGAYSIIKGDWVSAIDTMREDLLGWKRNIFEIWDDFWADVREKASVMMGATGTVIKSKLDDIVGWFADLPGRIASALGDVASTIKSKFSFDIPGISLGGETGGPGSMPGEGSTIDRLNSFMDSTGIPHRTTSTLRPGDDGFHGLGRAADFAGPFPGDMPRLRAIQQAWAPMAAAGKLKELIGPIERLNFKNGMQGPGIYPPNVVEGHKDHVHVAMHSGGRVTRNGVDPIKPDEVVAKLRAGETVRTREQEAALRGSGTTINQTFVTQGDVRADAQAAKLALMRG